MASPLPAGLVPAEVAFLCEMELVTIVPRERLEVLPLLSVGLPADLLHSPNPWPPPRHSGSTAEPAKVADRPSLYVLDQGSIPALRPPRRANLPLWLALLLKKQRRANIVPPPWLRPDSLRDILRQETTADGEAAVGFSPPPPHAPARASTARPGAAVRPLPSTTSPPFVPHSVAGAGAGALPYHWLEMAELLLAHAADDMAAGAGAVAEVRSLLKDVHEARAAKLRAHVAALPAAGAGVTSLRGLGALELAEVRAFVVGLLDRTRQLAASLEAARREPDEDNDEDDRHGRPGRDADSDDDMDVL